MHQPYKGRRARIVSSARALPKTWKQKESPQKGSPRFFRELGWNLRRGAERSEAYTDTRCKPVKSQHHSPSAATGRAPARPPSGGRKAEPYERDNDGVPPGPGGSGPANEGADPHPGGQGQVPGLAGGPGAGPPGLPRAGVKRKTPQLSPF